MKSDMTKERWATFRGSDAFCRVATITRWLRGYVESHANLQQPIEPRYAMSHRVDGIAVDPVCDDCGDRHTGACES